MSTLTDFVTGVKNRLEDPELEVGFIQDAVWRAAIFYSRRISPRIRIVQFTGDGSTYNFPLPSDWDNSLSHILRVEYPITDQKPSYIKPYRYTVYLDSLGVYKFRMIQDTPSSTEKVNVTYAVLHTLSSATSTIPASDEEAVIDLAAALVARIMQAKAARTQLFKFDADIINYVTIAETWRTVAEDLERKFKAHFGLKREDIVGAVTNYGDIDMLFPWGQDLLVHRRAWR